MLKSSRRATHSYHNRTLDLAKVREMAEYRLRDTRNGPIESILHLHSYEEECPGFEHEFYYLEQDDKDGS